MLCSVYSRQPLRRSCSLNINSCAYTYLAISMHIYHAYMQHMYVHTCIIDCGSSKLHAAFSRCASRAQICMHICTIYIHIYIRGVCTALHACSSITAAFVCVCVGVCERALQVVEMSSRIRRAAALRAANRK